jgi:hypothetical protein
MIYRTLHRKVQIEQYKPHEVCVAQSLLFCIVFCRSLFVLSEVCVAQSVLFCVGFCISLFVFSEVCVEIYRTLHSNVKIEQHKPH